MSQLAARAGFREYGRNLLSRGTCRYPLVQLPRDVALAIICSAMRDGEV